MNQVNQANQVNQNTQAITNGLLFVKKSLKGLFNNIMNSI